MSIHSTLSIALLSLSLLGMCLSRYASVIFCVVTFLLLLFYLRKREMEKVKILFIGLSISTFLFLIYLYNNYIQCGYLTGLPRSNTQDHSFGELTDKLFLGLFHQLHIIKQFRISSTLDLVFYLFSTFIQLSLMGYLVYCLSNLTLFTKVSKVSKLLILMGVVYLIFLLRTNRFSISKNKAIQIGNEKGNNVL